MIWVRKSSASQTSDTKCKLYQNLDDILHNINYSKEIGKKRSPNTSLHLVLQETLLHWAFNKSTQRPFLDKTEMAALPTPLSETQEGIRKQQPPKPDRTSGYVKHNVKCIVCFSGTSGIENTSYLKETLPLGLISYWFKKYFWKSSEVLFEKITLFELAKT